MLRSSRGGVALPDHVPKPHAIAVLRQHSVNTAAPPISIGSVGAALSGGPLIGDDFL